MPIVWEGVHTAVTQCTPCPIDEQQSDPPFRNERGWTNRQQRAEIHLREPTVDDHAILFDDCDLKIPLALWGIFSYFPTSEPTTAQLEACDDVYLLTPNEGWNPHSDAYFRNEENMLD
jgi:hypothetical protein